MFCFLHNAYKTVLFEGNGDVGKQLLAWKEYCEEYWLKELQECMDRCTGHHNIIEILLKNCIKHHTINQ